jgi:hypothetical protein
MKRTEKFPLSLSTFFFRLTTENQFSPQRHKARKEESATKKHEKTRTEIREACFISSILFEFPFVFLVSLW